MSKREDFEVMIAQRIDLASAKTGALVAGAGLETDADRRRTLEDCGLAIASAIGHLGDLKAADGGNWDVAQRDMKEAWRRMESAVRQVTGEPVVTLVPAPVEPSIKALLAN